MPPKFFITHSWKDIEFARRLCDDLRKHGLDGFFDAYSVKPGDKIPEEINRGLETCDIYVPLLSRASLQSPWCTEEISAALTLSNWPGRNGRPHILPVLIEECQDQMPPLLRTRLYIQFARRYDDALKELLNKGLGLEAFGIESLTPEKTERKRSWDETERQVSPPRVVKQPLRSTQIPGSAVLLDAPSRYDLVPPFTIAAWLIIVVLKIQQMYYLVLPIGILCILFIFIIVPLGTGFWVALVYRAPEETAALRQTIRGGVIGGGLSGLALSLITIYLAMYNLLTSGFQLNLYSAFADNMTFIVGDLILSVGLGALGGCIAFYVLKRKIQK